MDHALNGARSSGSRFLVHQAKGSSRRTPFQSSCLTTVEAREDVRTSNSSIWQEEVSRALMSSTSGMMESSTTQTPTVTMVDKSHKMILACNMPCMSSRRGDLKMMTSLTTLRWRSGDLIRWIMLTRLRVTSMSTSKHPTSSSSS